MKTLDNHNDLFKSEIRKIIFAGVFMLLFCAAYYAFVRYKILLGAEKKADFVLHQTERLIEAHISEIEISVKNMQFMAERSLDKPDSMPTFIKYMLENTEYIVGSGIAFTENFYPEHGRLFSIFASIMTSEDGSQKVITGQMPHDYTQTEWFQNGLKAKDGHWSEPYIDNVGDHKLIMSYSRAVFKDHGHVAGVLNTDINMDTIANIVRNVNLYPNSFCSLTSQNGTVIVPPPTSQRDFVTYDTPVGDLPWSLTFHVPKSVLLIQLRKATLTFSTLVLCVMLVFFYIIFHFYRNLKQLNQVSDTKQQMESELAVARKIQMSLLPPKQANFRDNVKVGGFLLPAKYVGGDLYDYFVRDEKLRFCIGDVSGKGVPSALLMSVAHSLFRTLAAHFDEPARIVSAINEAVSTDNPDIMFITLFVGVMDLRNGEVQYCNAGHNAPMLIRDGRAELLDVKPNLLLGVEMSFPFEAQRLQMQEGDSLFLYTDGLTEAANKRKELFGEENALLQATRHSSAPPKEQLEHMHQAVLQFVNGAEQSDDLTMFVIQYSPSGDKLTLTNDISEISRLEPFVENLISRHQLDPLLTGPINLALEETVSNVILYAYPEGEKGEVSISATCDNNSVTFIISDFGTPFDPTRHKEVNISATAEERPIGGLGIHLVKQIMDEVSYAYMEGKNVLTMKKNCTFADSL